MLKLSQRVYGIALVCILAIFAAVYRFAAWESASKEVSGFIDGSWFVALCLVVITVKAVRMIYKLFTQKFKFWYWENILNQDQINQINLIPYLINLHLIFYFLYLY